MEKRETFVQVVSKELIEEFLQFIQLDVSIVFSFIVILTVNVKHFLKSLCLQMKYSQFSESLGTKLYLKKKLYSNRPGDGQLFTNCVSSFLLRRMW